LAYSALPNLNDNTVCGQGLKLAGGKRFIKACKSHTNISPGDTVCTVGGNLACQYVLHVVGCDWKDNKKNNEMVCLNSFEGTYCSINIGLILPIVFESPVPHKLCSSKLICAVLKKLSWRI
jgi:hypothetical protein